MIRPFLLGISSDVAPVVWTRRLCERDAGASSLARSLDVLHLYLSPSPTLRRRVAARESQPTRVRQRQQDSLRDQQLSGSQA